jgi:hypothetical protein
LSGPPGPSEVLVAVERSRLPELGDDGAWLAEGPGRYLDPHSRVSLEDAIGTSRRAGDDHWRSIARQTLRGQALRELAKAACPGFGVSGQADEVRKRLRRILRRGGIMGGSI